MLSLILSIGLSYASPLSPTFVTSTRSISTNSSHPNDAKASSKDGMECIGGVCKLPNKSKNMDNLKHIKGGGNDVEDDISTEETAISELVKMGWNRNDAIIALNKTNFSLAEAAELLDAEESAKEELRAKCLELESNEGWSRDAAESALKVHTSHQSYYYFFSFFFH
jgi:hypothetical protein